MRPECLNNNREDSCRFTIGLIVSILFLIVMYLITRG